MCSEGRQGLAGKLIFIPIRTPVMKTRFDLAPAILEAAKQAGESLRDGDIVVISGKFIAMADGRVVRLADVAVGPEAKHLAEELEMNESLAQLVVQESDEIYGGVPGFALAIKDGMIGPNAGIDRSNVHPGYAILYPEEPFKRAQEIKRLIQKTTGMRLGVIISDSRLMPTRKGTTGVAIGVAGVVPVKDERGRADLFGNTLRYTQRAIADDLCAGVQLLMGEADEAVPVVIARFDAAPGEVSPWMLTDDPLDRYSLTVKSEECIYMRGLQVRPKFSKR